MSQTDAFGDRMKAYEKFETGRRFLPYLPVYARLDGRCFSKFTRGFDRPYDARMSQVMIDVTKALVKQTDAILGYTQSDEISLVWYTDDPKQQLYFDSKIQKMVSCLASDVTAEFLIRALEIWPEKSRRKLPKWDARVFQLPNLVECANALLWREKDATKNSITMAARCHYSDRDLFGKSGAEKQEMLFQKGVNWDQFPAFFKRGTFIARRKVQRHMTAEELQRIPQAFRPTEPKMRTDIVEIDMPPFSKVINRVDVVFAGAEPLLAADLTEGQLAA